MHALFSPLLTLFLELFYKREHGGFRIIKLWALSKEIPTPQKQQKNQIHLRMSDGVRYTTSTLARDPPVAPGSGKRTYSENRHPLNNTPCTRKILLTQHCKTPPQVRPTSKEYYLTN